MGKRTRIRGALDADRLVRAFDAVVAASDVLRMLVEPGERTRPDPRTPAATHRGHRAARRPTWTRGARTESLSRSTPPTCVYDSVLLRHADDDWTWWLDLHHVATDAAGSALVFAATSAAYEQLERPTRSTCPASSTATSSTSLADLQRAILAAATRPPSVPTPGRPTPTRSGPQPPIEPYGPRGLRTTEVDRRPVPFDDDERADSTPRSPARYRSISRELGAARRSA